MCRDDTVINGYNVATSFILQGACVESGQLLSEVDVNEETLSELLRCYISTSGNNLEEVSQQSFLRVERYFQKWCTFPHC